MRLRCCLCVSVCIHLIVARQRLGKNSLIVARQQLGKNSPIGARQRLGKNPHIVSRQPLGRNVTVVMNTHATIEEFLDPSFSM
jgi:UDP-3-O-[3-hydroxymyristoyl] glucosamine N-acyltransferase